MKHSQRSRICILAVMFCLFGLFAPPLHADDEAAEDSQSPLGEILKRLESLEKRIPAIEEQQNDQFQIAVHNYTADGQDEEVYIKLDRCSGKSWQLRGSERIVWTPIPEADPRPTPSKNSARRYELACHHFTKDGEKQEIYFRFDRHTGLCWWWNGTQKTWQLVKHQ